MTDELCVEGLSVALGGEPVLEDVSLVAPAGRTTAVLGPSGCGKTTLLRVVCGVERPTTGRVLVGDLDVTDVPPHRRRMGLAFQDRALFPHLDVGGNVGFGLRMAGVTGAPAEARVAEVLGLVGLGGFERRRVTTLSGGEAQRVGLARSLAPDPTVLCLDEPLGSLDRALHDRLVDDLRHVFSSLATTVLLVTHDHTEALALADHLVVLGVPDAAGGGAGGGSRVLAAGPPREVWRRPPSRQVASFLGHQVLDAAAAVALGVPAAVVGDAPWVVVPVDAVRLGPGGEALVVDARFSGGRTLVTLDVPALGEVPGMRVRAEVGFGDGRGVGVRVGERVQVRVEGDGVWGVRS